MKTVTMTADFDYRPRSGVIIVYLAGRTYQRVPEAAANEIKKASAGDVHVVKNGRPRAVAGEDGSAAGRSPVGD